MPKILAETLRQQQIVQMAWTGLGAPIVAETLVRCGYKAVNVDLQHGLYGFAEARDAIAAIIYAGGSALARIPVGDFATASRLLDCGADAIIAPMINSVADARAFVAATRMPPVGGRSYGPLRALAISGEEAGQDFVGRANRQTLALAMIETREALAAAEDILALDGIDGIFIGPSDLSISLSNGSKFDPTGEETMRPAAEAARKARAAGKIASGFAVTPEHADELERAGFTLIANGTDSGILKAGAQAMLAGRQ